VLKKKINILDEEQLKKDVNRLGDFHKPIYKRITEINLNMKRSNIVIIIFLILISLGSAYAATEKVCFDFNQNTIDAQGNYNATLSSGTYDTTTKKFGNASLKLSGSGTIIWGASVNPLATYMQGKAEMSVCGWVYRDGVGTKTGGFWGMNAYTEGTYSLYYATYNGFFALNGDSQRSYDNSNPPWYANNTWYHECWVFNGSQSTDANQLKLYVNGNLKTFNTIGTIPTTIPASRVNFSIGGIMGGMSFEIPNMYIDGFKVYDVALSSTEVTNDYNSTNGVPCNSTSLPANNTYIVFISQVPSDIQTTTLFNQTLNITYEYFNITNMSNPFLNYSVVSPVSSCIHFLNGTCTINNNTYIGLNYSLNVTGNNTINYTGVLTENNVYPTTENFNLFTQSNYVNITLTNANQYLIDEIQNVSNITRYGIYEAPVTSTGILRVYYYNSSYDLLSNVATNPNAVEISNLVNLLTCNHYHLNNSICHNTFPYGVINGKIGSVQVNGGGFIIRGGTGITTIQVLNNTIRTGANKLSVNNGNTWTNETYTTASHAHQFSGSSYLTYAAFGTFFGNLTNSSWRTDNLDVTPQNPSPPNIIVPNETMNTFNQFINITYKNGTANSVGQSMNFYNITLLNNDLSVNKTITANNGLNNSYYLNAYLFLITNGTYYIRVCGFDTINASSCDFEQFILNYTQPNLNITYANFTINEGLNATPITTINATCTNAVGINLTMNLTFNGVTMFYGTKNNNTQQSNTSTLIDGYNNMTITCSDFLGSTTRTISRLVYAKKLCLIDEIDNTNFNSANISSSRVYFDDNSSYYDFKVTNTSCLNYTSTTQNKLRFDLRYIGGAVITRYVDTSLLGKDIRVCANKEGVTHYEQLIIAASTKAVIMKSVYANCVIAADYTRFAYQDTLLLKAYSINTLYYLYTINSGVETYLAAIDGSVSTYVNLDTLEFRQQGYNLNLQSDVISFQQLGSNLTQIYYTNLKNDNTAAQIIIRRLSDGAVVFNNAVFANPNNITILFDYTSLGVNATTIFAITGTFTKSDGSTSVVKSYFNTQGKAGKVHSGVAFTIALLLLIFGLTLTTTNITFGWFGLIIVLGSLAMTAFAISTWYLLMLQGIDIIILVFIALVMTLGGNKITTGVQ